MNEDQMQAYIVKWFSNTYPEFRGLLFEINNDTANVKHAMKRRAMGMISGVSDLLFISPQGRVVGIELKAPETRHKTTHIISQLAWGELVGEVGGLYIISASIDEVIMFINEIINFNFDLANKIGQTSVDRIDLSKSTVKF